MDACLIREPKALHSIGEKKENPSRLFGISYIRAGMLPKGVAASTNKVVRTHYRSLRIHAQIAKSYHAACKSGDKSDLQDAWSWYDFIHALGKDKELKCHSKPDIPSRI